MNYKYKTRTEKNFFGHLSKTFYQKKYRIKKSKTFENEMGAL